ncbi:tetratricopeptide repeat protein [Bdellovibrio sp. HCB274]|uniref:tetratricopeptide repeat protein n=1 Tax=Bdellovibrio sp. HCB274 TaxID=3394361 RepID=UPI0039B5EC5C
MPLPKTAKEALYEGRYKDALVLLDAQLAASPQDIEALCDRALCWYQLGLPQELNKDLTAAYQLLSSDEVASLANFDHIIFVAKLMEEKGQFLEAIKLLQITWDESLSAKQSQMLKIQQLRLATETKDIAQIKSLYASVIAGSNHSLNFEIEREHALMLADFTMMGFAQAKERYQLAISHGLSPADKSFLKGEILELAVLAGQPEEIASLEVTSDLEGEYEKIQAAMALAFLKKQNDFEISVLRLEKTLSLVSMLRILRQALLLFPQSPQKDSRLGRYKLHVQSITHKSVQESFLSPLYLNDTPDEILAQPERQTIKIKGTEKIFKSKLFWQLLPLFQNGSKEVSFDEAITALYQEAPNLQHFDRLRVSLLRLNKEFEMQFNIKTVFKLSKTKLSLLIPVNTTEEVSQ